MANKTLKKVQILLRHDTASNWTSANPTLAAGEVGIETDTHKIKVGDGITAWTDLAYVSDEAKHAETAESASKVANALTISDDQTYDGSAAVDLRTEFAKYVKTEQLGVAGGVATLGEDGFIPSSQLPSYVDDIITADTYEKLPGKTEYEGEDSPSKSKIYMTTDTGAIYRWSGTDYVEIHNDTGTADSAVKLATARNFSVAGDVTAAAVAFDGTGDVTLQATLPDVGTASTYGAADKVAKITTDAKGRVTTVEEVPITVTWGSVTGTENVAILDPTAGVKLASKDKVLATWADGSGDATLTGTDYSGSAATAKKLEHAITIAGQKFDGSEDVTVDVDMSNYVTIDSEETITGAKTFTQAIKLNAEGNATIDATNYTGKAATAGAADTAEKLATARNINGVAFDGTEDITVTAEIAEPAEGIYVFDCGSATEAGESAVTG